MAEAELQSLLLQDLAGDSAPRQLFNQLDFDPCPIGTTNGCVTRQD